MTGVMGDHIPMQT